MMDEEMVNEYHDVLSREKFHFPFELVDVVLKRFMASGVRVSIQSEDNLEVNAPKDRCFFDVTMAGRAVYDAMLVTGNILHFPN